MEYKVKTFREAGLEVKWTRTGSGQPVIVTRLPESDLEHQRNKWWYVDVHMWDLMKKYGIKSGFEMATLIGDIFAI